MAAKEHTKLLFIKQVFSLFAVAFRAVVGKAALNTTLARSGWAAVLIGRRKNELGRQLTVVTSKMGFLAMKAGPIGLLFPWPISVFALLCGRFIEGVGASSLDGGSGFLLLGAIC